MKRELLLITQEMKTKIINGLNEFDLQEEINNFCLDHNIVDIKFNDVVIKEIPYITAYILYEED